MRLEKCVALQVALFNSATRIVYQRKNDFLVSFFCKLAFVGLACNRSNGWLVGLAVVANLQTQNRQQCGDRWFEVLRHCGRHRASWVHVDRIAAIVAGQKGARHLGQRFIELAGQCLQRWQRGVATDAAFGLLRSHRASHQRCFQ